jgi:hypothetical protein
MVWLRSYTCSLTSRRVCGSTIATGAETARPSAVPTAARRRRGDLDDALPEADPRIRGRLPGGEALADELDHLRAFRAPDPDTVAQGGIPNQARAGRRLLGDRESRYAGSD